MLIYAHVNCAFSSIYALCHTHLKSSKTASKSYRHTVEQRSNASLSINLSDTSVEGFYQPRTMQDLIQNTEIPANPLYFEIVATATFVNPERAVLFIESPGYSVS